MRLVVLLFVLIQLSCLAAPSAVERQAGYLRSILRQADEAYYNRHDSIMGDAAYDALRAQYDRLVATYPELDAAPSVGAQPADAANRIGHYKPVLSLQKAYSDSEVEAFLEKCGADQNYCIEPKMDGLTVVLRYRNGLLAQAITRGDGQAGSDVTAAILASGCVPGELKGAPEKLDVRGEVLIPYAAFDQLNQRRRAAGDPPLKSPRNTAAGTLRLKDYSEVARRGLEIRVFELLDAATMPPTHTEALAMVESCGLPVVECHTVDAAEVLRSIAVLSRRRSELPYMTDGIVLRVDDRAAYERLGATAHHPRGAIARKYRAAPVETRLLRVEWTRGATGKATPVAHFEPVELQGATVQRATLHNLNHLRAMDLMMGDWIRVVRAGGAVPEIVGICPGRRTGAEEPIPAPLP